MSNHVMTGPRIEVPLEALAGKALSVSRLEWAMVNGAVCLRDQDERTLAEVHVKREEDDTPIWHWLAFPPDYQDGEQPDRAVRGDRTTLGAATVDAVAAVLVFLVGEV
jgi:hypothetical protein